MRLVFFFLLLKFIDLKEYLRRRVESETNNNFHFHDKNLTFSIFFLSSVVQKLQNEKMKNIFIASIISGANVSINFIKLTQLFKQRVLLFLFLENATFLR